MNDECLMPYQCDFGRAICVGHHVRLYLHVSVVLTAPAVHPEVILGETETRDISRIFEVLDFTTH
jgi:hypothetical protein